FFLAKDALFLKKIKLEIRVIAFVLSGIILAALLSFNRFELIVLAYFLAVLLSVAAIFFRMKQQSKICSNCPEYAIRGRCTGFKLLTDFAGEIESLKGNNQH
ncbi:MAG: hypothetical protein ACFFB3_22145, partial [Candidatus Hodarchaeota archaeon]